MVSDSISPIASIPSAPKDFGKKKRANRSAKLKQCKLDARREQWLSQGAAKNKGSKEEPTGQRGSPPPCKDKRKKQLENLETRRKGGLGEEENERGSSQHDFDSDSPADSPTGSSVLGGTDSGTNFTASSSSSSSSSSGCCSGSITEEEEEEGDDNCLDDWEAMADALAANDNKIQENQNNSLGLESESNLHSESIVRSDSSSNNLDSTRENLRQECPRTVPSGLAPGNSRAWRPDDAFRPQSLPDLSKQRSFPSTDRHYGQRGRLPWACVSAVNVPSCCPICCEDFDDTDTHFMPCSCGFRLCLFCHKIILDGDGRCPGCRKPYEHDNVEAEASVHGGSLTVRLARSHSMMERS